jgi:hypothetical protein
MPATSHASPISGSSSHALRTPSAVVCICGHLRAGTWADGIHECHAGPFSQSTHPSSDRNVSGIDGVTPSSLLEDEMFLPVVSQNRVRSQALNPKGEARRGFLSQSMPTDKDTRHNYTLNYDWLLESYQKSATHILEVGVKKGGSIRLWREFFNEGAMIYGVDIDPAVPTFVKDGHIKILVAPSTRARHPARSASRRARPAAAPTAAACDRPPTHRARGRSWIR